MKKVYIETMGCQMNKSDTERILGMLSHFGYEETEEPKEANLLIINTCFVEYLRSLYIHYLDKQTLRCYPLSVALCLQMAFWH